MCMFKCMCGVQRRTSGIFSLILWHRVSDQCEFTIFPVCLDGISHIKQFTIDILVTLQSVAIRKKKTEVNNLQEDALLWFTFLGFEYTVACPHTLEQNNVVAGIYGRGVLYLMVAKMQKKGNKQKNHWQNTTKDLFHSPTYSNSTPTS